MSSTISDIKLELEFTITNVLVCSLFGYDANPVGAYQCFGYDANPVGAYQCFGGTYHLYLHRTQKMTIQIFTTMKTLNLILICFFYFFY
jgi:hypothetical protein